MIFNYDELNGFEVNKIFNTKKLSTNASRDELQSIIDSFNNSKLSADEFTKSVQGIDKSMRSYLKTCKTNSANMVDYDKHVAKINNSIGFMGVKSKAAAVGVGILNTALGSIKGLLVSFAIEGIIKLFDYLIETQEEIAEAASNARAKIDELNDSLETNQDFVKNSGKRYAELAQGINQLTGENLSLSTEDYEEFLSLSNELVELFPKLDRNYTDNGDAIVNLGESVDGIVGSLNELIEKQKELANIEIAESLPDLYKGVKSNIKKIKNEISDFKKDIEKLQKEQASKQETFFTNYEIPLTQDGKYIQTMFEDTDVLSINRLKKLFDERNIKYSTENIDIKEQTLGANYKNQTYTKFDFTLSDEEYEQILKEAATQYEQLNYDYNERINKIRKSISMKKEEIGEEYNSLKSSISSWLTTESSYSIMSDGMQNVMNQLVNNIDWQSLDFSKWEDAEKYIRDNFLYVFSSGIDTSALVNLFDESINELPVSEYIAKVKEVVGKINSELHKMGMTPNFNLDFLIDDQQDTLNRVYNKLSLSQNSDNPISDYVNSLSESDLNLLLDLNVDTTTPLEKIKKMMEDAKKVASEEITIDLSSIYEQLDNLQSAYQTVETAVKEYNENKYINYDTLSKLLQLDDQYLVGLMDENGQLQINTEMYKGLAEAKLNELAVSIMLDAVKTLESLNSESAAAEYLAKSTFDLTQAKLENIKVSIMEARIGLETAKRYGEDTSAREEALDRLEESLETKMSLIEGSIANFDEYFSNIFGSGTTTKTGTNKFCEQIDWVANSISNLQNKLDRLKIKLDNTFNITDKLPIYEQIEGLNTEILNASKEATGVYKSAWTTASSKISKTYKNKIMSGEKFEIQDFDNEETYNKVIEAKQAWDDYQASLTTYINALYTQDDLAKSKINDIIADKEVQMEILDIELENASTASQKNLILDERLELQKEINDELEKQAILENNDAALAALKAKEKQQEKENERQKRDNYRNENNVLISTYDDMLQNDMVSAEKKKTTNVTKHSVVNDNLKYDFQDIVDSIGEETWTLYLSELKKQKKETKMSDKKFIKKHLKEISEYFIGNGMYDWYNKYIESENDYVNTDYDISYNETEESVRTNDNKIKDIQDSIDLNGTGTVQQYKDIISLQDDNITKWTVQRDEAERLRDANKDNLELYRYWDNKLQDCDDKISSCNMSIKACRQSILELPLKEVEQKIESINKEINSLNRDLDDQTELINAAIAVYDEQIEIQNEIKEGIQERIDALQEEHDLRNANLNVQKAEWELAKARSNKTTKVFREGVGFVFESDHEEVQNAQANLDNAKYERKLQLLNEEIKKVDKNIDSLTKQKKQWEDIIPLMERAALITKAEAYDMNFKNKVLSGNVDLLTTIRDRYGEIYSKIGNLEETKEPYELLQEELTEISQQHSLYAISYEDALAQTMSALQQYYPELAKKYEEQGTSLEEVAKKQLEGVGVTEESSEDNLETVKGTNEKITQSYNTMLTDLTSVFEQLNTLLSTFASNAAAMASSVVSSVAAISSAISSVGSIDVDIENIDNINDELKDNYTKVDDSISEMYKDIADKINASIVQNIKPTTTTPVSVPNTTNNKNTSFSFGDINVTGVQNATDFAKAIVSSLPSAMKQELYKK